MMPAEWIGLASGLALAAIAGVLAWLGLRGGGLLREQRCEVACPVLHTQVECRIPQSIRTGRWGRVRTCTAFADPVKVTCEQECVRLMNLGLSQPRVHSA
jgi:hypothetical protein